MLRPFFIIFLIYFASPQPCCNNPNACPSNASCLCQGTVNSCLYQIVEQNITFTVPTTTSYFNWVPSTQSYTSVIINFCSISQTNTVQLKSGFKIQNSDATGYPNDTNITFSLKNSCYGYVLPSPAFCTSPSGGLCNLIVSLKLINSNSNFDQQQIAIYVTESYLFSSYLAYILVAIGILLFIVFLVFVIWFFRKRMMRSTSEVKTDEISITHFQKLIPRVSLKQLIENLIIANQMYSCSVCLLQISSKQMVRKTMCGHIFHAQCVDLWCLRNLSCPICRDLMDEQSLVLKNRQKQLALKRMQAIRVNAGQQTNANIQNSG